MRRKQLLLTSLILLVLGVRADGAATNTFTVKAGGGGNFTTIAGCAAVAAAGDTCVVYAGTYAGWTQSVSGSAGLPITFQVNGTTLTTCALTSCSGPNGDVVTITSAISLSSVHYIQIIGFTMQHSIAGWNQNTNHITVTHNSVLGTMATQADGQGVNDADNVFSYNVIDRTGITGNATGFYFYGDRNRFEHNEIKFGGGDCFDIGGANMVIRNNFCHDYNGASGEHLDFIQIIGGGTTPTMSFSLVEGNTAQNCTNDGGNCHGIAIIRTGGPVADTNIMRFNYAQNIDGDCINFGGAGDNVPNNSAYNNTCASGHLASYNGSFDSTQGITTNTSVFNNIAYNVQANGQYPFSTTSPGIENGNLAFTTGFSGSWSSPYSSEATYATLHNQNPLFANYPKDGTLQGGSPAIGAGVALTTASGSGSSSTSLTVVNAHLFQPGWAGVQGDWIRIGATTGSPSVQISSINYSTNVITLSSPQTWSSGAAIYLYKNSSGTVVLNNNNPDVGAFQSGTQVTGPPPNPPSNLQAIVN